MLCISVLLAVMCFNAKGDWVPAAEPLHKDVDLRKQDKCGVGPALVSASNLLFPTFLEKFD